MKKPSVMLKTFFYRLYNGNTPKDHVETNVFSREVWYKMLVKHEYRRTSFPLSDKFKYTNKYYSVTLVKKLKYNSIIDVNI